MNCHAQVLPKGIDGGLKPAIAMLVAHAAKGEPILWEKVHVLADFVYFHHGAHRGGPPLPLGFNGLYIPLFLAELEGMPRRIADYLAERSTSARACSLSRGSSRRRRSGVSPSYGSPRPRRPASASAPSVESARFRGAFTSLLVYVLALTVTLLLSAIA